MKPGILIPVVAVGAVLVLAVILVMPARLTHAPDISLLTTRKGKINLADYRGRPLLVTFWSTSCSVCIREMPHLAELYRELSPRGLEIIGIAMYFDRPDQVLELTARKEIPYTIALDINADASDAFGNIRVTPTSFLIAPDGRITVQRIGALNMNKLRKTIMNNEF